MHDVAKKAGVSISTVSYALNGTRPISEKTKQLIKKAMQELGYNPNALARGLAGKKSRIIAMLCPLIERGIGSGEIELLAGAADTARKKGYHLVLWTYPLHKPDELRKLINQELVDGIIIMEVHENDPRVQNLSQSSKPFCMIGRSKIAPSESYIDLDFDQAVNLAVEHLHSLGHRHIAFVNQSEANYASQYGPAVRAQHAFIKEMHKYSLTPLTAFCHPTPVNAHKMFSELLQSQPKLTALIIMNDRAISGIIQSASEKGLGVPEHLSLVSIVTNSRTSELFMPPITSVDYDGQAMGQVAVEMLIEQLEKEKNIQEKILLPLQLVIRDSTSVPNQIF
jgi:DNA-binding LacI/PurR family transcriptional regulator